jgi:hexosaminidase
VNQKKAGNWTDDPAWCRWQATDATVTIDLGKETPVKGVTARFFHETVRLVFPPSQLEVSISNDGTTFTSTAFIKNASPAKQPRPDVMTYNAVLEGARARFVRVTATGVGPAPAWHKRASEPTWLFMDELIIE